MTTTEVALWTGLTFDQKLYDSNPLKFYEGPESISTTAHKKLLQDKDTVQLDARIVDTPSIAAARTSIPLEDFYEMLEEVSWV